MKKKHVTQEKHQHLLKLRPEMAALVELGLSYPDIARTLNERHGVAYAVYTYTTHIHDMGLRSAKARQFTQKPKTGRYAKLAYFH